jgi:two-component sensor histidine kinase
MDGSRELDQGGGELQVVEIRHRLANCFQLLNGLIQARLAHTTDGESRRQLAWLQDVVVSLGILQQRLAAAGTAGFRAYLVEAAELWRRLTLERDIKIELETEDIEVAPARAAPLSLILHELMTNCCEHAFPKECGGTVRITFRHAAEARAELAVSDDGVGLPPQEPMQSFGLSVVRGLAAQLGGTFSVGSNSPGAIARVEISLVRDNGGRLGYALDRPGNACRGVANGASRPGAEDGISEHGHD